MGGGDDHPDNTGITKKLCMPGVFLFSPLAVLSISMSLGGGGRSSDPESRHHTPCTMG